MNSNIRTLKRVRRTHAKFAALNLNAEDGGVADLDEPPETAEDDPVDEFVDERPWKVVAGLNGGDMESGVELGREPAVHCLRWMNGKVLEHAGFQGECSQWGADEQELGTESLHYRKVPLLQPWMF